MQMGSHVSVPTDGPALNHEQAKDKKAKLPAASAGTQGTTSTQAEGQQEVNDWTKRFSRGYFCAGEVL